MLERLTMPRIFLFFSYLAVLIAVTFACNGCTIKKAVLKPCPGTEKSNVIKVLLDSLVLTSDCKVKTSGTVNITKPVKTLESKYEFQKGVLKKTGESDGCKDIEKAAKDRDSGDVIKFLGLPEKCPLQKQYKKINKEVDVSKYKDKMTLLNGPSSGKLDVSHGGMGHSCYTFDALVECKRG